MVCSGGQSVDVYGGLGSMRATIQINFDVGRGDVMKIKRHSPGILFLDFWIFFGCYLPALGLFRLGLGKSANYRNNPISRARPSSDMDNTGGPPPELIPGFYDDRSPLAIFCVVFCLAVATVMVGLRIWTRKVIINKMGMDDWAAIITLVCLT